MIIATTTASLDGPRKNFGFPSDFTGNEDKEITARQRSTIIDLIFQRSIDTQSRELLLSQLDSILSYDEAEDFRFSLLTNTYA